MTRQVVVAFTDEEYTRVEAQATANGGSIEKLIKGLLDEYLETVAKSKRAAAPPAAGKDWPSADYWERIKSYDE